VDQKASWRVVLVMLGASMVFYAAIGLFIVAPRNGPVRLEVPAFIPVLIGVVALGGSAAIASVAAVPHNSLQRFRVLALASVAVLDGAALAGVVLTVLMWQTWPVILLASAGILGMVVFVVPASNAWFRANEGRASGRPESP